MRAWLDASLEEEFTPRSWARGVNYFERGRVQKIERVNELCWEAVVRGSRREPYQVCLDIDLGHAGAYLQGGCTCPAAFPCKHLAAVLYAVRERHGSAHGGRRNEVDNELYALESWAEALEHAPRPDPRSDAPNGKRLVYVLSISDHGPRGSPCVGVEAHLANVLKSGALGKSRPFSLDGGRYGSAGSDRYTSSADRLLWFRLTELPRSDDDSYYENDDFGRSPDGAALLRDFVETGRCYFGRTDAPQLRYGPPRPGRVEWMTDAEGRQRLVVRGDTTSGGEPANAVVELLPLQPPHYLERDTGCIGPLRLDLPDATAAAIADLPALDPETVVALPDHLRHRLTRSGLPSPVAHEVQPVDPTQLRPRLVLRRDPSGSAEPDSLDSAEAVLHFDYGPLTVVPGVDPMTVARVDAGMLLRLERDVEAEASLRTRLLELGFSSLPGQVARMTLPTTQAWQSFIGDGRAGLDADGWTLDVEGDFPLQLLDGGAWYLDLDSESSGAGWFDLELGIDVDGEKINLLPVVVTAIQSGRLIKDRIRVDGEAIALPLGDGRWVSLPSERLRHVLDVLVELFDERLHDDRLRLNAGDAGRLLALDDMAWTGDTQLRSLARQLARADALPTVTVPRTLKTPLRGYQARGLDWLAFLGRHGFGGVLADDMGLGKTVQALAHMLAEKRSRRLRRPCLVVCPRSVLHNWIRECERFAPTLTRATYHGPERGRVLEEHIPDLVVTTYALLQRDDALRAVEWQIVLLDEAQAIKNPRTKVAAAARSLKAQQRLCLTGTPMENNLGELWSLFAFVCPGLLGGLRAFNENYRRPIERDSDTGRLAALSARVAPFMLRRTKAEVLPDLPPKTEIVLTIPFETRQRDLYESVRMTMEKKVREALSDRGLARSQIVILDALLKLRQVCCHPALVKSEAARSSRARSAKMDRLMEILGELIDEDRHVVLFSQFTSMLDIVAENLDARGVAHARITGRTRARQAIVDAFQSDAFPVLLVSLKAGGTGINLTRADTVIHYDPWWNPAVEAQATDRAHRIGQQNPITVYRLVCEDTVEQRILELQERKRALTEVLQRDAEHRSRTGLRLEPEDLELLLASGREG